MFRLNNKPFDQWTEEDISILLSDEWRESDTLDYKREWKKTDDEFKNDVCSFANHEGGTILYGIIECNGVATDLCGTENLDEDKLTQAIDCSLSNCIEPVKPRFNTRVIPLDNGKCVLVLEIKEGYRKPYCNKNDRKFFIRSNAGKVQMSYLQIEEMFLRTNASYERIEQFLDKRARSLENPSNSPRATYLSVHLIPVTALLSQRKRYDLTKLPSEHSWIFQSDHFRGGETRMNADGFVKNFYCGAGGEMQVQVFWNGTLEAVTRSVFQKEKKRLDVFSAAAAIDGLLEDATRLYKAIGLAEQVSAVISLRNVSSLVMYPESPSSSMTNRPFEQNDNRSSDVLLDLSRPDIQEAKKHLLDELGYMLGELNFYGMCSSRRILENGSWGPH